MNSDNTLDAAANLDLIDRYLRNELNLEQLFLFEERLRKDPDFLEEVEFQRRIILTVKEAEIRNLLRKSRNYTDDKRNKQVPYLEELTESEPVLKMAYRRSDDADRINIMSSHKAPIGPRFISIPYEGDSTPPFRLNKSSGKVVFSSVEILQAPNIPERHYQFKIDSGKSAILFLVGVFNPKELTLIYYRQQDQDSLKLRIGTKEYKLKINEPVAPLAEDDGT
jgi:hypothetical protein